MITIIAVAALLCAASTLVGSSVVRVAGGSCSLAPAVGLAVLLAVAVIGARIGDGIGAAVAITMTIVAAIVALAIGPIESRWRFSVDVREKAHLGRLSIGVGIAVVAILAAALPFFVAGHTGVLGVGLINDDMASHLQIAEHVREPLADPPRFAEGGYPIGPHAVVAGLAEGLGLSIEDAFAALTIALAPLLALTLLNALNHLPPARRALAALVAAFSYLSAAYLGQGAFKEPLEAIIVIAFALALADLVGLGRGERAAVGRPRIWRAAPVGFLAAASVLNYSLPGLGWVGAVASAILVFRYLVVGPRPQRLAIAWRRLLPYVAAAFAIVAVATISEWGRVADFTSLDAFRAERDTAELGNLRHSISPAEALGIWPTGDFRTTAADAGGPAIIFWLGAALALLAAIGGVAAAWIERRPALVGALAATAAIWVAAAVIATPYFAAKALAIGAPMIMALSLGWALAPGSRLRGAVAAALILGAVASSFLVLRSSPVGPEAHAAELDRIRPHVEGSRVLFLGRDDFIGWHLRRAEVDGVVKNHFNVGRVPARYRNPNGAGDKFDIDAVTPKGLRHYDYVLMTRGEPRSDPGGLPLVEETESYDLFAVGGPGARTSRRTLHEGSNPGAKLSCGKPLGERKHDATAFLLGAPVEASPAGTEVAASDGSPARYRAQLLPGQSAKVSVAYDSRRPLSVVGPGLDVTMPANLDFRGPTPLFLAGTVKAPVRGGVEISAEPQKPGLFARLLGAPNEAHIRAVVLSSPHPALPGRPMSEACGRYVDYYVPSQSP